MEIEVFSDNREVMSFEQYSIVNNLEIEKIIFKGFGLGHAEGKTILVYQGVMGDIIDVRLVHKRGDTYFAEIVSYRKKSSLQQETKCRAFAECGGCDWLNLSYTQQLASKQIIIQEFYNSFEKEGSTIASIVPSPNINYYRNKVFLPVSSENGALKIGMYARRSHRIVENEHCYIQPEVVNLILATVKDLLIKTKVKGYNAKDHSGTLRYIGFRYSVSDGSLLLILVTKGRKFPFSGVFVKNITEQYPQVKGVIQNINESRSNRILGSEHKILYGVDWIEEKLSDCLFRARYDSFFQINTLQAENLLKAVEGQLGSDDIVVDAYSGIGTFGVAVANSVQRIFFLEQQSSAMEKCKLNIEINGRKNCFLREGPVEETLSGVLREEQANTIILDPPRKGLENVTIETIISSTIRKILYISCDISTQKRDIERFCRLGFTLKSITPFDMFPHTYHIESLALLIRN